MVIEKPKTIVIRVDSSSRIGVGHVMRCLTLANQLKSEEHRIVFLCKQQQGDVNNIIKESGFEVELLSKPAFDISYEQNESLWLGCHFKDDAKECQQKISLLKLKPVDLLIIDHYSLDHKWQNLLMPYCKKIMVIDDLANRKHVCDILLDQTFGRSQSDYGGLTPQYCMKLVGNEYILLRDEFKILRKKSQKRRKLYITEYNKKHSNGPVPANIIITMGGSDPENLSQKALLAIEKLTQQTRKITTKVVISSQSKHLGTLALFCQNNTWASLIIDSKSMAELMLTADIAIGACGGTAWERCALGLPCLTTVNAENQQVIANNLANKGAIINLGWHQNITIDSISFALKNLQNDIDKYAKMVNACFDVCDGVGARKVAQFITTKTMNTVLRKQYEITNELVFRDATLDDCELTFHWQSNKKIRQYFTTPETPSWQEHSQWYQGCLKDKNRTLLILQDQYQNNIGLLRLDKQKTNQKTANCYEISIIIAPKHQGNSFSVIALKNLVKLNESAQYIATIDTKNTASQRAFIKAGFEKMSSNTYQLTVHNFKVCT